MCASQAGHEDRAGDKGLGCCSWVFLDGCIHSGRGAGRKLWPGLGWCCAWCHSSSPHSPPPLRLPLTLACPPAPWVSAFTLGGVNRRKRPLGREALATTPLLRAGPSRRRARHTDGSSPGSLAGVPESSRPLLCVSVAQEAEITQT